MSYTLKYSCARNFCELLQPVSTKFLYLQLAALTVLGMTVPGTINYKHNEDVMYFSQAEVELIENKETASIIHSKVTNQCTVMLQYWYYQGILIWYILLCFYFRLGQFLPWPPTLGTFRKVNVHSISASSSRCYGLLWQYRNDCLSLSVSFSESTFHIFLWSKFFVKI